MQEAIELDRAGGDQQSTAMMLLEVSPPASPHPLQLIRWTAAEISRVEEGEGTKAVLTTVYAAVSSGICMMTNLMATPAMHNLVAENSSKAPHTVLYLLAIFAGSERDG